MDQVRDVVTYRKTFCIRCGRFGCRNIDAIFSTGFRYVGNDRHPVGICDAKSQYSIVY
jgi:hypothetical protein